MLTPIVAAVLAATTTAASSTSAARAVTAGWAVPKNGIVFGTLGQVGHPGTVHARHREAGVVRVAADNQLFERRHSPDTYQKFYADIQDE